MVPAVVDTLQYAWTGPPDVDVSRAKIDALPYATLRAKFGKSPRSLLVLGRFDGNDLQWMSADRGVLVTRNGRLVRTVGFIKDLRRTDVLSEDPVQTGLHELAGDAPEIIRLVDIEPGHHYQVPVRARLERREEIEIDVLERVFRTVHVIERGEAPLLRWKYTNEYWADVDTGFIWRSIQHFAPDLPPMEMEILKPAVRSA